MSIQIDSNWANWFVGFCDGEGSFTWSRTAVKNRPVVPLFKLEVQDDHDLIRETNDILFGGGYVALNKKVKAPRKSGKEYENRSGLQVQDKLRLMKLVKFFDAYPLRSHKNDEFQIWRTMVLLKNKTTPGKPSRQDAQCMLMLAKKLSQNRVSGMSVKGKVYLDEQLEKYK